MVFTHDTYVVADNTAGYAPQSLLWATHMVFMPSLNAQQRQTRFFQYLYYGVVTPGELEKRLKGNSFVEISALFGYERYTRHLTAEFRPLNDNEVRRKIREYADFVQAFDDALATHPVLSYVIVPAASQPDFSQLDRWYVREPVERVDEYLLFRVKLRINP